VSLRELFGAMKANAVDVVATLDGRRYTCAELNAELDELFTIRNMLIHSGLARMLPSKGISPELAETHKRARVFSRDAIDVRALALASLAHQQGVRLCRCGLMSAPHGPCRIHPRAAGEEHGRRYRCEACCECRDPEYFPSGCYDSTDVDSDDGRDVDSDPMPESDETPSWRKRHGWPEP